MTVDKSSEDNIRIGSTGYAKLFLTSVDNNKFKFCALHSLRNDGIIKPIKEVQKKSHKPPLQTPFGRVAHPHPCPQGK